MDDINQCSLRTLTAKTGIPEDLASRIIEYKRKRSCRPPIKRMKELWRVKGMTSPMFKKIECNFTVLPSSYSSITSSTSFSSSSRSTSTKSYTNRNKTKRKISKSTTKSTSKSTAKSTAKSKGKKGKSQTKRKKTRKGHSVLKQTARVAPIQRKRSQSKGLQNSNHSSVISQIRRQSAPITIPMGGIHSLSLNPVSIATSNSCNRLVVKYCVGGMSQPLAYLPEYDKLLKSAGTLPKPIQLSPKDIEKLAKATKGKEMDKKRSIESWLFDVKKNAEMNTDKQFAKKVSSHVRIVDDKEVPSTSRGYCSSKYSNTERTRSSSRERSEKRRKHHKRHHHRHHHSKHKDKRRIDCNVNGKHYQPVEPSQGMFDHDKVNLVRKVISKTDANVVPTESQLERHRKRKLMQEKYCDMKRHRTSGDGVVYRHGQAPPPSLGYCVIL